MYERRTQRTLGRALSAAFLAGAWDAEGLTARGRASLDRSPRWLGRCALAVLEAYPQAPADRPRELAAFVVAWLEGETDRRGGARTPRVVRWHLPEGAMGRTPWPAVPAIASVGELAAFLELSDGALAWLADARGAERSVPDEALRNYRYGWVSRRAGDLPRLIERPKRRLKAVQRLILREIVACVPPHDAAHGFVAGRSARTHAAQHTGQRVILRLDLEDFFASIPASRVYGIYRSAGYPEAVAHRLAALATNVVPVDTWAAAPGSHARRHSARFRLGRRLATPHLPQGAPTSPALANLAAFRLDRRLTGLATVLGARYTRYADDLTFSGGTLLLARAGPVRERIAAIARDEGFRVNPAKSLLMSRAGRQRVCGIVVNERPNVTRAEYDELKAIVHNAVRFGPERQNRAGVADFRSHLLGRIAWVGSVHAERGARLREGFERIAWDADGGEAAE